jgi:thiamine-phosphate pyrophosphorylase
MTPPSLKFPAGLYGVTPDWDDAARLEDAVRAAARGGLKALQLRHKTATPELRRHLAKTLLNVCNALDIVFVINDDWRLALELGAHGVHVGQHDDDPARVRQEIGPEMLLGVSCYADPQRAQQMLKHDVAYIAFGAMYASSTKPLAPTAPLEVLRAGQALCQAIQVPRPAVVAIGGISIPHAATIAAAGADSIAVVGSLFLAQDIEAAARALSAPFIHAPPATSFSTSSSPV